MIHSIGITQSGKRHLSSNGLNWTLALNPGEEWTTEQIGGNELSGEVSEVKWIGECGATEEWKWVWLRLITS